MTRPALYRPPDDPVLFLDAESEHYARDYAFALRVYRGSLPRSAAAAVGIRPDHARVLLCRWRDKAAQWVGQPVSDTMVLRLMCERDRAEADLQKNL